VGGALNTYLRVGKLFPGPHLFAGAGITVCWALAASLVPAMKKGNDTARSLHIALNAVNVALFAWQVGALLPQNTCSPSVIPNNNYTAGSIRTRSFVN
jgi:hypothetical protein